MQAQSITPGLVIADQPDEPDIQALGADGYAAVVNLRHPGEPEQPLSPEDEGGRVRALGLDYLHVGIGGGPLSEAQVGPVLEFLDRHDGGKVLVHCRKGGRAAALVLIQQARRHGWAPGEAVDRGRAMGLVVEGGLRMLVEQYLAENPAR